MVEESPIKVCTLRVQFADVWCTARGGGNRSSLPRPGFWRLLLPVFSKKKAAWAFESYLGSQISKPQMGFEFSPKRGMGARYSRVKVMLEE
jgi:hypothetical protein